MKRCLSVRHVVSRPLTRAPEIQRSLPIGSFPPVASLDSRSLHRQWGGMCRQWWGGANGSVQIYCNCEINSHCLRDRYRLQPANVSFGSVRPGRSCESVRSTGADGNDKQTEGAYTTPQQLLAALAVTPPPSRRGRLLPLKRAPRQASKFSASCYVKSAPARSSTALGASATLGTGAPVAARESSFYIAFMLPNDRLDRGRVWHQFSRSTHRLDPMALHWASTGAAGPDLPVGDVPMSSSPRSAAPIFYWQPVATFNNVSRAASVGPPDCHAGVPARKDRGGVTTKLPAGAADLMYLFPAAEDSGLHGTARPWTA